MKKRRLLALFLAVEMGLSLLSGCASRAKVTEDMIPTVTDLGLDRQEMIEEVPGIIALAMNQAYMAEWVRLDGDNSRMAAVDAKEIPVVLKATSVDKDLKVKIVNKKNDRVITGTKFEVSVTDANKNTKAYTDDDKDGIIYIKSMEPGTCTISMKASGSYKAAADIKAEVKANIEYAVVDIADEIKKESEINVSKEDSNTTGNADAGTAVTLKDTVEFVASSKTEIMKQKVDEFGTPVFSRIISEPARFHTDSDKNGSCDRCGAKMSCTHNYTSSVTKEANCTTEGVKTLTCGNCGDVKTEPIPKDGTKHDYQNGKCTRCQGDDPNYKAPTHEHNFVTVTEAGCESVGKKTCSCGAEQEISPKGHDFGEDGVCKNGCGTVKDGAAGGSSPEGGNPEGAAVPQAAAMTAVSRRAVPQTGGMRLLSTVSVTSNTQQPAVAANVEKIVYDTSSTPVMVGSGEYKYTGWQTIDGATYYYDKNGNKVTGSQVIQGIQYTFSSEGVRSGTIGIDVSKYQTNINWKKVKNAGINFVIIRCGYRGYGSGVLVEDPMFASHISGAKAAGLRVGVYFFSQAITEAEAVEEASMAVKLANRYGINMPIAIDSEYAAGGAGRADGLSRSARTKITIAFCNTVRNAGHTPMVYASKSWFSSHLDVSQFPASYRIWVAHYAAKCGYTGRYDIWQNTSQGQVDGIPSRVDMNISSI